MGDLSNRHEIDTLPLFPVRQPDSHKGTYGNVLIAAGCRFMPGAAVLAARAAYRSGAGLVTVLTDSDAIPMVAAGVTESVFTDWAEIGARLPLVVCWLGVVVGAEGILCVCRREAAWGRYARAQMRGRAARWPVGSTGTRLVC